MSQNEQYTKNLGLLKASDKYGTGDPLMRINGNWDIIDDQISKIDSGVGSSLEYKTVSVSISWNSVNLTSFDAIFQRLSFQGLGCILVTMHAIADNTTTGNTFTHVSQTDIQNVINIANKYNVPIVMLKPHVVTMASGDAFDRGTYNPIDVNGYFTNWLEELKFVANIAKINNIPMLSLACEQPNQCTPTYYGNWQTIVNSLKALYPDLKLTLAYKTWEIPTNLTYVKSGQNSVMSLLDFIGYNVYLSYTYKSYAVTNGTPNITLSEVCKGWYYDYMGNTIMKNMDDLTAYFNKPIFITESGVMNRVDGLTDVLATGAVNYDVQALHFKALFEVPCSRRDVIGFSIWHVSSPFTYYDTSGATITSAEQVLLDYIKGGKL